MYIIQLCQLIQKLIIRLYSVLDIVKNNNNDDNILYMRYNIHIPHPPTLCYYHLYIQLTREQVN